MTRTGRFASIPAAAVLAAALATTAGCRSMSAPPAAPDPAAAGPAAEAAFDPDAPPPIPPGIDPAHLHFTRSQVQVGDPAPDFTLARTDGRGEITLSALRGRPVVLVFGSFT